MKPKDCAKSCEEWSLAPPVRESKVWCAPKLIKKEELPSWDEGVQTVQSTIDHVLPGR